MMTSRRILARAASSIQDVQVDKAQPLEVRNAVSTAREYIRLAISLIEKHEAKLAAQALGLPVKGDD